MDKRTLPSQELLVSASDIKRLFLLMRKKLWAASLWGAFIAVLCVGLQQTQYRAEASFNEKAEQSTSEGMLRDFISGIATSAPQATTYMKSQQVLKPLVEKLGLQVSFPSSRWFLVKLARRYADSWRAERGRPLLCTDPFSFEDVHYEEDRPLHLYLVLLENGEYSIYGQEKKTELARAKLGEPLLLESIGAGFTLTKVPESAKIGAYYPFSIQTWFSAAADLRSQIKIQNDKDNRSVLHISVKNKDRYLAAKIVNELMRQYQAYLKRDYDETAKQQLAYLANRKKQLGHDLLELFDQHAAYLERGLKEGGLVDLEQEFGKLLEPHQQMRDALLAIDLEIAKIDELDRENDWAGSMYEGFRSEKLKFIPQKINELQTKKDQIEFSLCKSEIPSFQSDAKELKELRNRRLAIEQSIQDLDAGREISSSDLNSGLSLWAQNMEEEEDRENLAQYLENYARLLSIKEKALQAQFFPSSSISEELEGLDLEASQKLYFEYNGKLDAAEALIRHYERLKEEIPGLNFELSSLNSILPDPFSQTILQEASGISFRLKDEKHRTGKEGERWREELVLYKKVLLDHLDQLIQVQQISSGLIRQKMRSLQKISLDNINCQLSILQEQAADALKEARKSLFMEKELLENKMEKLCAELASVLPEKWRFEKWLNVKTLMVNKAMEAMTQVVETKTIASHLHHVQSKPLDLAIVPAGAESNHLFASALVAALLTSFGLFLVEAIRQCLQGFPLSLEKLKALQLPSLGTISAFCDGPSVETPTGPDLDLLRHIALFSEGGKVISLLNGKGPDYSYALGEHLARRKMKSIIVRCDFLSLHKENEPTGVLQICQKGIGELQIRSGKGFDFIPSGGYSPYGTEMIQSPSFHQLLELLKKNYAWVFLLFRSPLSSAESLAALRLSDKAVATVIEEKIQELTPLIHWGYDAEQCRITFLTDR